MKNKWRVAGINFDHFHMGDLLRMVHNHPQAEIVGISDTQPERMEAAIRQFAITKDRVFSDYRACLEQTQPDMVLLCPATAEHALWTERVAEYRVPILMEKPLAASLAEADRMIAAMAQAGQPLAINWPLRWYQSHAAAKALIDQGLIGDILEVHYYDGNRGPLYHGADKMEREPTLAEKVASWFYRKAQGGGSLQDYLGYGVTLGTWYLNGAKPIEVTCMTDDKPGLEVDEHSITVARYPRGLAKFETRWGTFTDPWTHQPQPKCGFVIVGSQGTLSSYDYEKTVRIQTAQRPDGEVLPAPDLIPPASNPVEYFLDCLAQRVSVGGPLSPAISRIGQQIVDTACRSAQEKRTLPLIG